MFGALLCKFLRITEIHKQTFLYIELLLLTYLYNTKVIRQNHLLSTLHFFHLTPQRFHYIA